MNVCFAAFYWLIMQWSDFYTVNWEKEVVKKNPVVLHFKDWSKSY